MQAQTIGKIIDKNNYEEYESLLIPAMLEAAKRGDWTFPTANLDFPTRHRDHFLAASKKNEGKCAVEDSRLAGETFV